MNVNMKILIRGISQLSFTVSRKHKKAGKIIKNKANKKTNMKENNIHKIINI